MVISEVTSILGLLGKAGEMFTAIKEGHKKKFTEEIKPHFENFKKVHESYKESFSRYRDEIINAPNGDWIRPLQASIEKDNTFTGDERAELIHFIQQLKQTNKDGTLPFIDSVCNYIMDANLVEPLGKEMHPNQAQRWRQGFTKTLDQIAEENWLIALDPNASRPPMSPKEITKELKEITQKYPVSRKISKPDATKRAVALWALNAAVNAMQNQYAEVCAAYAELETELTK
ncbi:MAG: hypothetical protein HZB50_01465 [Chloroflexi bacterium]|nr:hypothetical protein [Chloroflexota bacterium]